jgi:peptidoglycan/xylan/chitin deacetylase (PgdA/CDA1 family)
VKKRWNNYLASQIGAITHVRTKKNIAALTFDDGPDPEFTPELLAVLKRHNAKGTFFLIGKNALGHLELVKNMFFKGHAIGNHSFNHVSFTFSSSRDRRTQIRKCRNALKPYGANLFRPPYGNLDLPSHFDIRLLGYKTILWNVLVEDWLEQTADTIHQKLNAGLRPGAIILLHDRLHTAERESCFSRSNMIAGLSAFLQDNPSFQFVPLPDLLLEGTPVRKIWRQKGDSDWTNALIQSK